MLPIKFKTNLWPEKIAFILGRHTFQTFIEKINQTILFDNFLRRSNLTFYLFFTRNMVFCIVPKSSIKKLWSDFFHMFYTIKTGSFKWQLKTHLIHDISGIHTRIHMHDGNSCFSLLIEENALNWACSAVLWEK